MIWERYGVCKLSGWSLGHNYLESWSVYDRAFNGEVVARFPSYWNHTRKRWSPVGPSTQRRAAKLLARKLNVDERRWEEECEREEYLARLEEWLATGAPWAAS